MIQGIRGNIANGNKKTPFNEEYARRRERKLGLSKYPKIGQDILLGRWFLGQSRLNQQTSDYQQYQTD